MGSEWPQYRLDEITLLIADCPHSTPEWTDSGVIVLRSQNIRNGSLDLASPSFTNDSDYKKRINRAEPLAGDIVLTREAPMGEVCQIPQGVKCCLGQRMVLIRADEKKVLADYLLYVFQSSYLQHQINWNQGTGTTVSNIRIPYIKAFKIPTPTLEVQAWITNQLKIIDLKISINRQINQTLEQMAQTLFKSWFIDFDPVIDNALDAGNPIPDSLLERAELRQKVRSCADFKPLPTDIRALFPAEFEETELGWVPKSWRIGEIGSFGKVITGKTPPTSLSNAFTNNDKLEPFITPTDISNDTHVINTARYLTMHGQSCLLKNRIPKGSISVTCIGSQMGKSIILTFDAYTNQQINSIIPKEVYYRHYLFLNLRNRREELLQLGSSGSTMPIINKSTFSRINMLIPKKACLSEFDERVSTFLSKIERNLFEVNQLNMIRDTLLPKLISGELQLDDLPETVSELEAG